MTSHDAKDTPAAPRPTAEEEVVRICRDLIRIDSSNYGDGSGPGERKAAEYVMAELAEVGLEAELLESNPGRSTVVLRLEGEDLEDKQVQCALDEIGGSAHGYRVKDSIVGPAKAGHCIDGPAEAGHDIYTGFRLPTRTSHQPKYVASRWSSSRVSVVGSVCSGSGMQYAACGEASSM